MIFRKLLIKYNLLHPDKTSVVIGNHDIFGGVQTALDVIEFPKKCKNTNYEERIDKFAHYFKELFANAIFADENMIFPFVKILGDHALFGMNSIEKYSRLKNPFASSGKIPEEQLNLLRKLSGDERVSKLKKLLMIHHHFYKKNVESTSSENGLWNKIETFTMKLKKKKNIMKQLQSVGIDLVLHGHSHEMKEYNRKGIKFLNAGASIDNNSQLAEYYSITSSIHHTEVNLCTVPRNLFTSLPLQFPNLHYNKLFEQPAN
jgi:predicted phosphodiesterase